jgi:hypothetical protein
MLQELTGCLSLIAIEFLLQSLQNPSVPRRFEWMGANQRIDSNEHRRRNANDNW